MSRYKIPALQPDHEVWIGWDAPLQTFFLQVDSLSIAEAVLQDKDDHRDPCIVWKGTRDGECRHLEDFLPWVEPYGLLDYDTLQQLCADQAQPSERSPLQEHMLRLLRTVRRHA